MQPKQYKIRTIDDLLNIPEDRLDAFLTELKIVHKQGRQASAVLNKLPGTFSLGTIRWVDDGIVDVHMEPITIVLSKP